MLKRQLIYDPDVKCICILCHLFLVFASLSYFRLFWQTVRLISKTSVMTYFKVLSSYYLTISCCHIKTVKKLKWFVFNYNYINMINFIF